MDRGDLDKYQFIQANSPDGGFLQSEEWRRFQESAGRKTSNISGDGFWANIIEHRLPIVGKYFYIPRGPIIEAQSSKSKVQGHNSKIKVNLDNIVSLARKNNIGWIRFDANSSQILEMIGANLKVVKAPHDMQPRELFIINIAKSEEELLSQMKTKTRYNIRLAQKHDVKTITCEKHQVTCDKAIDEFMRLVKVTAQRDRITPHPDVYYRKMFETIPAKNLKLYMAEFEGKVIAANVVVFYGKVATYLHGASENEHRNVMAPYLLQWQAMVDAKTTGHERYDLGGVMTDNQQLTTNNWGGITRFKTGFSASTEPTIFPGSYDIVINPLRYNLYKIIQRIKAFF